MTKSTRTLVRWGLVTVDGDGPFLAGMETTMQPRTSTKVVELDMDAGTALTVSGRLYRLSGSADGDFAVRTWAALWNTDGKDICAADPENRDEFKP